MPESWGGRDSAHFCFSQKVAQTQKFTFGGTNIQQKATNNILGGGICRKPASVPPKIKSLWRILVPLFQGIFSKSQHWKRFLSAKIFWFWFLNPPDTKGDLLALPICKCYTTLKTMSKLAESDANDGNAELKIQTEFSGIEGVLFEPAKQDPWAIPWMEGSVGRDLREALAVWGLHRAQQAWQAPGNPDHLSTAAFPTCSYSYTHTLWAREQW